MLDMKLFNGETSSPEEEEQRPKKSWWDDVFTNAEAYAKAAYANTRELGMGRDIKDTFDKINNKEYSSREEYDKLIQDLDRLEAERNAYRNQFQENQQILNQNDSMLKDYTEIGGTAQGIATQAKDTAIGLGTGAAIGSAVPILGTSAGAMAGAKWGNRIGAIHQAINDADMNAIDAWEKVLNEGGTTEQAEQAYKDAFWNNMPTEASDILTSMYFGGKLTGTAGNILNRVLGGRLAGTLAKGASKVSRFDLPAKVGTYVAQKTGNALLGQGVGVGLSSIGNGLEERIQEPWQDYATERAVDIQRRQYDPENKLKKDVRDFSVLGEGGLLDYYTTPEGMETGWKAQKMGMLFGGASGLMTKSQFTELGTAHSDSIQSAKREADWIDKQGLLKDEGNLERYNNVKETMANVYDLSEDEKADLSVEDVARMYHEYYTNLFGQGGNRQEQNAVSQADFLNEITGEETARRGLMGDTATKYIDEFGIRPDNETLVGINDNQQVLSEEQVQETLNQDEEETTGEETENKEGIKAKASKPDFFGDKTSEQAKEEKASSEAENATKKKGIPDQFGNWKKIEEDDGFDHDLNNIGAEAKYENTKTGRIAHIKRTKAGYQVTDVTDPKDQGKTRNKESKKKLFNFLNSSFANQKTKFMSDGTQEQEQVSQALPKEDGVISEINSDKITEDAEKNQWYNGRKIQSNKAVTLHSMQDLHDYYKTHKDLMSKDLYAEISRQMMRFGIGNANNTEIVLDLTNREAGGFGSETAVRTDPNDENSAIAKAIVRLYAGADLATAAHEMAHLGWMNLSDQDRATFTKWAEKTQGEFIAKILGMDYDQNFRSYLIEALTNRESKTSQDLWAKIKREGAVQQTLGILNGQNYGLAVEERFAWEFSNWYAQGYIKGAKPRNIIERILNKACATLQGALNLLSDTNRYLNGENGYNGGDINNIFTNMSTRRIGQQRQTVAPQVETVTRMDYAPEMGYDLAQGLPNVADSELGMTLDEEPEQNLSGNYGTTRVNQKAEKTAQQKTKTGYGEGVANNNETLEQYRERMKKEAEQKKEEKKQNYTPTPQYKPKERNRKVGGYEQTSPQGETLEQYKQREAEEAEKYKVPTSLKGVRKLLTIVKNRKEGWQRALQSLKQIDPRKFRSIKTQIGNDLWGVSEDYVNDGNDLWGQPKQQSLFGEEFEETKSEPKTQVEETTEETKKTNTVEEPSLFDNQEEQVDNKKNPNKSVENSNLTNENQGGRIEENPTDAVENQTGEVAESGETENTRGTENLQGNVGEVQRGGSVRQGNDNRTGEGRVGQNSVEERSEGNGKDISLLKNSKFKSVYNARKEKKTEVKDWRDLSDSDQAKQVYVDALNASKEANKDYGVYVSEQTVESLKDCKVVLHKNKMAGFAITPDGNIVGVFSNPKNPIRGILNDMIFIAHMMGGNSMDCFGSFLLHGYRACGFTPVARTTFDEAYYPADNPANATIRKEKPDVFFLVKDNDNNTAYLDKMNKGEYENNQIAIDDIPLIDSEDSYGDALGFQGQVLEEIQKKENKNKSTKEVADSLRPKEETTTETQQTAEQVSTTTEDTETEQTKETSQNAESDIKEEAIHKFAKKWRPENQTPAKVLKSKGYRFNEKQKDSAMEYKTKILGILKGDNVLNKLKKEKEDLEGKVKEYKSQFEDALTHGRSTEEITRNENLYKYLLEYVKDAEKVMSNIQEKQNKSQTETPVQNSQVERPVATKSEPVETETKTMDEKQFKNILSGLLTAFDKNPESVRNTSVQKIVDGLQAGGEKLSQEQINTIEKELTTRQNKETEEAKAYEKEKEDAKNIIQKEFLDKYREYLKDIKGDLKAFHKKWGVMPSEEAAKKYSDDNLQTFLFFRDNVFNGYWTGGWEKKGIKNGILFSLEKDKFLSHDYYSNWKAKHTGQTDFFYVSKQNSKQMYKDFISPEMAKETPTEQVQQTSTETESKEKTTPKKEETLTTEQIIDKANRDKTFRENSAVYVREREDGTVYGQVWTRDENGENLRQIGEITSYDDFERADLEDEEYLAYGEDYSDDIVDGEGIAEAMFEDAGNNEAATAKQVLEKQIEKETNKDKKAFYRHVIKKIGSYISDRGHISDDESEGIKSLFDNKEDVDIYNDEEGFIKEVDSVYKKYAKIKQEEKDAKKRAKERDKLLDKWQEQTREREYDEIDKGINEVAQDIKKNVDSYADDFYQAFRNYLDSDYDSNVVIGNGNIQEKKNGKWTHIRDLTKSERDLVKRIDDLSDRAQGYDDLLDKFATIVPEKEQANPEQKTNKKIDKKTRDKIVDTITQNVDGDGNGTIGDLWKDLARMKENSPEGSLEKFIDKLKEEYIKLYSIAKTLRDKNLEKIIDGSLQRVVRLDPIGFPFELDFNNKKELEKYFPDFVGYKSLKEYYKKNYNFDTDKFIQEAKNEAKEIDLTTVPKISNAYMIANEIYDPFKSAAENAANEVRNKFSKQNTDNTQQNRSTTKTTTKAKTKTKKTTQVVNEDNIENNTKTYSLTEQQNQTNAETKKTTIDKSDKNYQKAVELVIKNRGMSATGLRLTLKDEGIVVGQEQAEQYLVQMENDGIVEHGDEGSLRLLKKNPSTKMQEAGQNAENQTLLTPQVEEELENLFWKLIRKKQFHGMDSRWASGSLDYYKSLSNRRQGKEFNPEFIKEDKAFLDAIKNVNDYIHEKFPQYKNVYRGVDGHWRFEFSDKDAHFINGFEKLSGKTLDTTLDKILKHDNLYKFYSKLKGMPVHLVRNTKMQEIMEDTEHDYYAMYDPETKSIYINSDMFESNDEVRNSLLHEIQHAIQDIEGFANGTNDNAYNNDYDFSEGEKQAVLTENRSNMSDEELQQNPRSKTLNPNEKTIIEEQRPVKKVAKSPSTKMQSNGGQQKADTNTPQFKKWFNGSVVKNNDGSPKVYYRGLNGEYDVNKQSPVTWVSPSIDQAYSYSDNSKHVYPVYVSVKNPANIGNSMSQMTMQQFVDNRLNPLITQAYRDKKITKEQGLQFFDELDELANKNGKDFKRVYEWYNNNDEVIDILKQAGYDALLTEEDNQETYGVFNKGDVKSVYNKGTFDRNNPDIKFQSSGNGQTNLGYIDKQKDIYSVTFTKSAQQNAENKKKMDFYRKNKSYWRENKDAQTGSITFTRALPYQQHQKTIIYDEINGKKVGKRKKAKWREYYEAFKDHMIKWLFNDKHFLEKAARNVGAIESYMRMMVMKDQGAVAGAAIEDGIVKHNGKNGERTKSLNSIIEAVGEENQTDFLNYCEAYRVLDLEKRNIYQKMTPDDARKEIAKVQRSKNAKLFEQQRQNFVEYNHELLWVLVDGGFITEKQYDNFIKIDPNFIPLAKNMDELEGYVDGFRDSKTMINVAHPMHKIGTSMREVANPFLEMQKRTVEYYVKASRNKAGHIFVHDIAEAIAQNAKGDVVAQNQGMVRKLASRDKNGNPISHDNKQYVFYVWENGEKQYYQVADREIYVALKSFDAEQMGALSKIMNATAGKASRLVRNTATMTPDFGLRNLVRDNMEAFISSEHGFLPLVDSLWGMYQMANDTQWFKEYQRMNGEHLSLNRDGEDVATVEHDIKDNVKFYKTIVPLFKKDLHEFMDKDRSKPARAKSLLKLVALDIVPLQSIYKANKRLNDYLETGTRIGEYRNARMGYKGLKGRLFETSGSTIWTTDMDLSRAKNTEMIAAYKSKDITLNFGQHGVLGKELNRYIPFFNASLQGIYKLGNTLDDMIHAEDARRRQELMFKCALMGAMGMAAALAGQGDDDYDEAPDYEHENFWILPNGIRIPKDQLFGKLIGGTVEKATAQYLKDGDVKKLELVQDVLGNFAIDKCVPALVDLGWGTIGNYDSFKKKSVTPEYMADKLGYLQKDLSTSKAGADISKAIFDFTKGVFGTPVDVGAKKVDFVISKTLSNLGKYATSLWELTGGNEKMTRGAEVEDKGGFAETSKELPYPLNQIVGTFATNRNSFQSISDFYERHRELKKLSSDESIMSKNEKKAWEAYQAAYKKDKQYRDALKAIKLDKSLTGAQKRQKADKIFKQQISMARKLHDWEKKHGLV